MTHVARVELVNWGPFRGEHSLDLKPKAYGVFAREDSDPDRSNGLGKTSLVSVLPFVFYGHHTKDTEDGWITNGEPNGSAAVTLSDGTRVLRSRHRGKSTKLWVYPTEGAPLMGDEAMLYVERLVGLSKDDYLATCYVAQKSMSKLVTMRPAERMEVVAGWLRLGPLERCHEIALSRLQEALNEQATVERDAHAQGEVVRAHADGEGVDVLTKRLAEASERLRKVEAEGDAIEEERRLLSEADRIRERIEQFDRLAEEGKAVARSLPKPEDVADAERNFPLAEEALEEARRVMNAARDELSSLTLVASGDFDGRCPVTGGCLACPARDAVVESVATNRTIRAEKRAAFEQASKDVAEVKALLDEYAARIDDNRRKRDRIADIRARMEALGGPRKALLALGGLPAREEHEAMRRSHALARVEVEGEIAMLRDRLVTATRATEKQGEHLKRLAAVSARVATIREAIVLFGRQGAQRAVAEAGLAAIEQGANDTLAAAGIPLTVRARWSRTGTGVASSCAECGTPFARGRAEKSCSRCGAARGANVVNALDVVLSDRSGALDDLAGIALQLSASHWLRTSRSSTWSTVVLDEPFGALDAAFRRALSRHLRAILDTGSSLQQALVIAHSPGVLETLPGRIVIGSDGEHSRILEVV